MSLAAPSPPLSRPALGFVLFLCLTFYVISAPPAPLALCKRHIDQLWPSVQHRVHSLAEHLPHLPHLPKGLGLHDLSDGFHHLQESLHSRVDQLVHGVDSLVHGMHEEVTHAAAMLHEGARSLLLGDQHHRGGGGAIQDALLAVHTVRERLTMLVQEALSGVVVWPVPRWPVYVFLAGAMICLLLSAVCHLFGCCSQHVAAIIWRFDYAGIAILIVASFYPPVYYGFLCQPWWQVFYLSTTTVMGRWAHAWGREVGVKREWRTRLAAGGGLCWARV